MRKRLIPLLLIGLYGLTFTGTLPAAEADSAVARWDFNVYVGNKRVGKHYFEVSEVDGMVRVESEADFKYKILFIPAYRYEHTNSERWADNCLVRFEAKTNANGKRIRTRGARDGDGFKVAGEEGLVELPECVMSFAYWNPAFLEQQRLLNPQSGAYVDVTVEELPRGVLEVRGEPVLSLIHI